MSKVLPFLMLQGNTEEAMKKFTFITCLLLLVFMVSGCKNNESVGEKNAKAFLKELYQVESTDEYQELIENVEEYFNQKRNDLEEIITIDEIDGSELFESFYSKYRNYCSEAVLQTLITSRYITKYDQKAWEEKCQFYVKEIVLEQNKKETYCYTIQIEKRLNDNSTQLKSGEGIIQLNKEGLVDWFKITKELKDL